MAGRREQVHPRE